jgi:predicted Zn-dependent protease
MNTRSSICFLLFAIAMVLASSSLLAQRSTSFMPLRWHEFDFETPSEMQKLLKAQMKEDRRMYDHPKPRVKFAAQKLNTSRTKFLMDRLDTRGFVKDEELEKRVNHILQQIVLSNDLPARDRLVVIINSNSPNAANYARGLFLVSVALLARIETESELASILAHELAHDEGRHVQQRILKAMEEIVATKNDSDFGRLFESEDDRLLRELQEYRKLIYGRSSYSRAVEREADSVGLVYVRNAGYDDSHSIRVMELLQTAKEPWFGRENFFKAFNFARFPFQDYWLRKRLSLYTRKPSTGSLLFEMDSLQTHPELESRKTFLTQHVQHSGEDQTDQKIFDEIRTATQFQTVEASYAMRRYDQCLYFILDLLREYPGDPYLVSRAGKILLDLYEAKNNNTLDQAIAQFTGEYGEQMQEVNTMLHNISKEDMIELAYHFMNINFDKTNRSHYYLLWHIAQYTGRDNLKTKVEDLYETTFDDRISAFKYSVYYNDK